MTTARRTWDALTKAEQILLGVNLVLAVLGAAAVVLIGGGLHGDWASSIFIAVEMLAMVAMLSVITWKRAKEVLSRQPVIHMTPWTTEGKLIAETVSALLEAEKRKGQRKPPAASSPEVGPPSPRLPDPFRERRQ